MSLHVPMSDTIILLSFLKHYGIDKTLSGLEGMFAFAFMTVKIKKFIWHGTAWEKSLFLFADRPNIHFLITGGYFSTPRGFDLGC